MFDAAFTAIDHVFHNDAGCSSELDYTEQTILVHKDYAKKVAEAIAEVKSRSSDGYGWVEDTRNGRLFEDDTELNLLKNRLGDVIQTKLVATGLITLGKLRDALDDDDRAKQLVKDTKGLSLKMAKLWKTIFCRYSTGTGRLSTKEKTTDLQIIPICRATPRRPQI